MNNWEGRFSVARDDVGATGIFGAIVMFLFWENGARAKCATWTITWPQELLDHRLSDSDNTIIFMS